MPIDDDRTEQLIGDATDIAKPAEMSRDGDRTATMIDAVPQESKETHLLPDAPEPDTSPRPAILTQDKAQLGVMPAKSPSKVKLLIGALVTLNLFIVAAIVAVFFVLPDRQDYIPNQYLTNLSWLYVSNNPIPPNDITNLRNALPNTSITSD